VKAGVGVQVVPGTIADPLDHPHRSDGLAQMTAELATGPPTCRSRNSGVQLEAINASQIQIDKNLKNVV
jgi:hypothetical protein